MPIGPAPVGARVLGVGLTPQEVVFWMGSDEEEDCLDQEASDRGADEPPRGCRGAAARRPCLLARGDPLLFTSLIPSLPCLQMPERSLVPLAAPPRVVPLLTATVWRGSLEATSGDACRPVSRLLFGVWEPALVPACAG